MRNKAILMTLIILLVVTQVNAKEKKGSISVGAGNNQFSGIVQDIYSGTNISYGFEIAYRFSEKLEAFLHTDYLKMKGELSYSKSETEMTLFPLETGARFLFGEKISPYLGAGAGSYSYKEKNEIGEASGSGFGFFGEGGLRIELGSVFFDLKAKYVKLKIDDVDLSGVKGILSFGVGF